MNIGGTTLTRMGICEEYMQHQKISEISIDFYICHADAGGISQLTQLRDPSFLGMTNAGFLCFI